jgi:protein-S-isoprenylcysteine O-methyltransferase Ste14
MYYFLIPLILGFASNLASAFTFYYSEKWGRQAGTFITILLRDIFGIPLWAVGFLLAIKEGEDLFFKGTVLTTITGWSLIALGGIIIVMALITIRSKAAAPSTRDELVHSGLYSVIRHPIHTGTFLEFTGLFILWPSLTVAIAFVSGVVWIFFQSKFEELDLKNRIRGYSDYMKSTPPFFPFNRLKKYSKTGFPDSGKFD